jgi:predicted dehydrogenase
LEGVQQFAAQYGARAYRDYDAFLSDPEVRMVHVATPDWLHCEHALAALEAGKAVLLQKPPCVTVEELALLRAASDRHPGMLKICLNTRETYRVRRLRELVESGVIGELVHIRISYRGKRYPITDLSSPYLSAALGGVWLHNGMHWLDEGCVYAGHLPTRVQVFAARNDNGPAESLGEGPNYWSALFDMGPGVTFRLEYNTMLMADGLPGGMQRVLIGTAGEIRLPYGTEEVSIYRAGTDDVITEVLYDETRTVAGDTLAAFVRLIDAFAGQLLDGCDREPAIGHSLECMAWLLAGVESAGTMRSVSNLNGAV